MLFSGTDNHISGLGAMQEIKDMFKSEAYANAPGYEYVLTQQSSIWRTYVSNRGYLNFKVAALPEILTDNGYRTILSGKWSIPAIKLWLNGPDSPYRHLGMQPELAPHSWVYPVLLPLFFFSRPVSGYTPADAFTLSTLLSTLVFILESYWHK